MYGGCALSTERSEAPPKAAADSRVGCAGVCDAGSRRGWQWSATRAAPSSGTAHSLATTMLSAAADAGRGVVYGAVGPRAALWRCGGVWAVWGLRALGRFGAVPGGMFRGLPRHEGGAVIAGGSHCSAAQRLWALGRFADAGWQDLRAVHDSRGPCSEKGPFLARSSRGVSSDGDLRGFSDTWRAHLAKASSFRMHGARILPRTGDFPVQSHFWDAWSAKIATDGRLGTHRGGILPRQDPRERTAREYCHCQSGQERIRAQSRYRRTLGNAFREYFAIVERPGTHQGIILPRPDAHAERPALQHRDAMRRTRRFVVAEKVSCGLRVSMR